MKLNNIVSLSGGKDSTAMLHMMLERGDNVHSAVFFDTGWEFPEMYDHLDSVEQKTGVNIVRLRPDRSFSDWMFNQKVIARKGIFKGKLKYVGNGWPSMSRRWCTRIKVDAIRQYQNKVENHIACVGYAADEIGRERKTCIKYPLDEFGMTEADCLQYCNDLGYHWDGLYEIFDRVSCFCCPLQGKSNVSATRTPSII